MHFLSQYQISFKQLQLKLAHYFPALFFVAGFAWDALTIGRKVAVSDLYFFAIYLLLAGFLLYAISRPAVVQGEKNSLPWFVQRFLNSNIPYELLQFLFGSLLSALFFLYFVSTSHALAWLFSLLLAVLLVANEFLQDKYKRLTLSWAIFGLCAMLLLNFALPFLLGSVLPIWFYLSTMLGTFLTYLLYAKTPRHLGSIQPVGVIAVLLMLAYSFDMIPPVPLVKRDIAMAYDIKKQQSNYVLTKQKSDWWVFWRQTSDDLLLTPNQRIFCFSSVFAPQGLSARLYHRWQIADEKTGKWLTQSRIGFNVVGGRDGGYRGYSYKQNLKAGVWQVAIETEAGKTIATHEFTLKVAQFTPETLRFNY